MIREEEKIATTNAMPANAPLDPVVILPPPVYGPPLPLALPASGAASHRTLLTFLKGATVTAGAAVVVNHLGVPVQSWLTPGFDVTRHDINDFAASLLTVSGEANATLANLVAWHRANPNPPGLPYGAMANTPRHLPWVKDKEQALRGGISAAFQRKFRKHDNDEAQPSNPVVTALSEIYKFSHDNMYGPWCRRYVVAEACPPAPEKNKGRE